MAAGPKKLAWMIAKLGGGAEHCDGADGGLGVASGQGGQFTTVSELLQGVGEQGQALGGTVAMEQDVEGSLFHHGGEDADLVGQPLFAQVGLKPRGAVVDETAALHQQLLVVGLVADPAAVDDEAADVLEPGDGAAAMVDEDDARLAEGPDILPAAYLDGIVTAHRQVVAHREDGGGQDDEVIPPGRALPHAADEVQLAVLHLLFQPSQRQEALISLNAKGRLPRFHESEEIDADPADMPVGERHVLGGRRLLRGRMKDLGGANGPGGEDKQTQQQDYPEGHPGRLPMGFRRRTSTSQRAPGAQH